MSEIARDSRRVTLRVEALSRADAGATARLHRVHLPHGLFPRLGTRFVSRWHRTFIDDPAAAVLGVRSETGELQGFLLGTLDQQAYARRTLTTAARPLAALGLLALLTRPRVLSTFLRTRAVRYGRRLVSRTRPSGASGPTSKVGVLHALVCVPEARGQGIGAALVEEFERLAEQRGTPLLQLVTRADGGAAEYYCSLGWQLTDQRRDRDGHPIVQLDRSVMRS